MSSDRSYRSYSPCGNPRQSSLMLVSSPSCSHQIHPCRSTKQICRTHITTLWLNTRRALRQRWTSELNEFQQVSCNDCNPVNLSPATRSSIKSLCNMPHNKLRNWNNRSYSWRSKSWLHRRLNINWLLQHLVRLAQASPYQRLCHSALPCLAWTRST